MKNRIASRIALSRTPRVATAAASKLAKAPPPAVVYNWTRNKRHVDIGPALDATNHRNVKVPADSVILTFTYH